MKTKETALIYGIIFLVVLLISGCIGVFTLPYMATSWGLVFGKTVVITKTNGFWLGCVPLLGQLSLPLFAITWLCMLFLL